MSIISSELAFFLPFSLIVVSGLAGFIASISSATICFYLRGYSADPDIRRLLDNGSYFRIGDLIQLGVDNATTTKLEVMEITAIADPGGDGFLTPATLTVKRALYGSNLNDKDAQTDATEGVVSGANVYFPFFNTTADFDKFS